MLRYTLRRLLAAIPTLFGVLVLAFLIVHAAPGGPFDEERALPPDVYAELEKRYGLDQPLIAQFGRYVKGLARGDFGPSLAYRDETVARLIAEAFPLSLLIGGLAMILALAAGIGAGAWAALHRDTWFDRFITGLALTGLTVPIFVVAPLLVLVFAIWLDWLPTGWTGSGLAGLVLPVIALALPQLAYIARLVRGSLIDVLGSDFVRTARGQGLTEHTILREHALKPAMLPLISYLGPAAASILTGSVVVEKVFGIPGLGRLFVDSAGERDYMLVLGIVLVYAILVIVFNLVVDILYRVVDPRIRYS